MADRAGFQIRSGWPVLAAKAQPNSWAKTVRKCLVPLCVKHAEQSGNMFPTFRNSLRLGSGDLSPLSRKAALIAHEEPPFFN